MSVRKKIIGVTLTSVLAAATFYGNGEDFIKHHEGEVLTPYLDPVGIRTICSGHTGPGTQMKVATAEVCARLRKEDAAAAFQALDRNVKVPLTDERAMALLSFVFNFGETKFKSSTLLKKLNAGQTRQACDEFLRWINAGGKPLHGLVVRRADERSLCLVGL
jgi:lysozyme